MSLAQDVEPIVMYILRDINPSSTNIFKIGVPLPLAILKACPHCTKIQNVSLYESRFVVKRFKMLQSRPHYK